MDSSVPLAVVKGTILFYSRECEVVLDQSWTPEPRLILNGIEDLVDGELERGEVLCRLEGLKQTQ